MLSMTPFMNQTIPWFVRTATKNEDNEYTYTETTLTCRVTYKREMFRNRFGEKLLSNAIIHTEETINEGDRVTLDGVNWHVEMVRPYVNKAGTTIGWKAIL